MREAVVIDVTPPTPEGTRAPYDTQVAELDVDAGARRLSIALVLPAFGADPAASKAVAAEAMSRLPSHLVVIQPSNGPGVATVATTRPVDESDSFLVAAAAAVIQHRWGWEDSPVMVVTVNGVPVSIQARHQEGKTFLARLVDAA